MRARLPACAGGGGERRRLCERVVSLCGRRATAPDAIDFSSNDYLGLARDPVLHREVLAEWQRLGSDRCTKQQLIGSTGSRLLSGNTAEHERLEAWLASFHGHEAALLFNSGYDANLALLACVPAPGDAVLYDEARVPRVLSRPSRLFMTHHVASRSPGTARAQLDAHGHSARPAASRAAVPAQ